jgi:hypothetical protein
LAVIPPPVLVGNIVKVGDDPSQTHFVQEYKRGTECVDEHKHKLVNNREITIEMRCGTALAIKSIQEVTYMYIFSRICI